MYYDSDEVRNVVGQEIWTAVLRDGVDPSLLSSWELDAIIRAIREAIENVRRELVNTIHEWAKHIAQVFTSVAQATKEALEAFCELVDLLGLLDDGFGQAQVPQAAWPRRPVITPVRIIDAVAAGRHPAMTFRARRVGGRR